MFGGQGSHFEVILEFEWYGKNLDVDLIYTAGHSWYFILGALISYFCVAGKFIYDLSITMTS